VTALELVHLHGMEAAFHLVSSRDQDHGRGEEAEGVDGQGGPTALAAGLVSGGDGAKVAPDPA